MAMCFGGLASRNGTNKAQLRYLIESPAPWSGVFCLVNTMSEITNFFQKEAQVCRGLAQASKQKRDRDYWMGLAERWEELSRGPEIDDKLVRRRGRVGGRSKFVGPH